VTSVPVEEVQEVLRRDGVLFTLRELCGITPRGWRDAGGYDPVSCAVLPAQPRAVTAEGSETR
jgi:hypothetical protein